MEKKPKHQNLKQNHSEKYISIVKDCIFVNNRKH